MPPKPEKLPIGYNGKDYVKPEGPYLVTYPWPGSLRWQWKGEMGEKALGLENKWEYAAKDWPLSATCLIADGTDNSLEKGKLYVRFETDFTSRLRKLRTQVREESQEKEEDSQDKSDDNLRDFVAAARRNFDGTLHLVDEAGRPVAEFELRIAPKSDKTQNDQ